MIYFNKLKCSDYKIIVLLNNFIRYYVIDVNESGLWIYNTGKHLKLDVLTYFFLIIYLFISSKFKNIYINITL